MDSKGIIYGVYWKESVCIKHFYEMDDAIEWCKKSIEIDEGSHYDTIRYCVDKKSDRYCLVGYNVGTGDIFDYEIEAIDVY